MKNDFKVLALSKGSRKTFDTVENVKFCRIEYDRYQPEFYEIQKHITKRTSKKVDKGVRFYLENNQKN